MSEASTQQQTRQATQEERRPKGRKLRQLMVVHKITSATKLYAAISERFSFDKEYACQFFDTQEAAEAFAASCSDPCHVFLAKPVAEPAKRSPQEMTESDNGQT